MTTPTLVERPPEMDELLGIMTEVYRAGRLRGGFIDNCEDEDWIDEPELTDAETDALSLEATIPGCERCGTRLTCLCCD